MAAKRGSKKSKDDIEDAEIVAPKEGEDALSGSDPSSAEAIEGEPADLEAEAPAADEDGPDASTESAPETDAPQVEETKGVEATDAEEVEAAAEPDDAAVVESLEADEAESAPEPEPLPQPIASPPPQKGASPFALVIGGIVAAVIGFVLAQIVPDGWPVTAESEVTDALAQADADLAARITDKADAADVAALGAQLDEISGQLTALLDASEAATGERAALTERVVELEARPIVDLSSLDTGEALEAELEALRQEIAAVSAEAQRQIEAARNEATILEQNAADAAAAAARRAALSRVLAALDAGVPFEDALAEFETISDADIPEALRAAAPEGVATLASLQADYPPLARDALAAMRAENAGGENTVGNAMRRIFGVRSLEPQEGDTPDAVLSRVEAGLLAGDLEGALTEICALPASGADVLAPWTARVEMRLAAFAAAAALTQSETTN